MRKSSFIILLFTFHISLFTFHVYSQFPTQEWVARYIGPSNDLFGPFLQADKFGNSYITGTYVVNDTPKVLCVKYNTNGVQLWSALYIYPGEAYIRPSGLALDSSGNAYVISDQGASYLLPTNGLIVKFNSLNGSLVWIKKYVGQYGWSAFRDIKIDRLNNIYVAGWSDTSHLVIRYNTYGDTVWVRKYHPSSTPPIFFRDVARACTIDDSLNIIFTGKRMRYYPPYGNDLDSLLVVKYSSSGALRWQSVYADYSTGITEHVGIKITADQNGSLYIGGSKSFSGDAVYLTLKYDRNGTRQWVKIYDAPGGGSNSLTGIAMDRINNALYVTGTNGLRMATTIKYNILTGDSLWVKKDTGTYKYGSSGDINLDSSGNIYITGATSNIPLGSAVDVLTIKYSQQGNRAWFITYNGPFNGADGGYTLRLDTANNVYVLGTSQSSEQIFDYIVIKYSQILGLSPGTNKIPTDFNLSQNYPNPFNPSTKIKFSVPKRSFIILKIFDVLGRVNNELMKQELSPSEYEISFDGTNYSSGVYFYQLIVDGKILDTKKFIVLK